MTTSDPAKDPTAPSTPPERSALLEPKTRNLIEAASRGSFSAGSRDFGDTMKRAFTHELFASTWAKLEDQAGKLTSIEHIASKRSGGLVSQNATCVFSRARLVLSVAYDEKDEIVGFHVLPATADVAWTAPGYVNAGAFEERKVTVGSAHPLPGVLTLPKGGGPHPVVILVHGSGPNDEDETVGGVKVFRDLAGGLGSKGVSVLRYAKRSKVDPTGIVTQKEEVTDAVRDAIDLARRTPEIDGARVFVLGHSQGGYLAPRIAKENPGLAGVVVLAGSAQPLQDSVIEQITYLSSLDARNAPALAAQLDAAKAAKRAIESPSLKADDDVELLGTAVKGAYFLDVRGYDPPAVARELDLPLLVLQGERDYQVTMRELARWRTALGGQKSATVKSYPTLNHLFVAGEGTPSPAEYASPGHVDAAIVGEIATWVLAQAPARAPARTPGR